MTLLISHHTDNFDADICIDDHPSAISLVLYRRKIIALSFASFDQSVTRVLSPSRCYCRCPPPPLPPPGSCPPCTRAPSEIVERLFELSLDKRSDLLTNNGSSLVCQTQSWYVVITAHQSGHLSSGQIRAERSHNLALGQTKPAFEDLRLQQQAEMKRMINCQ